MSASLDMDMLAYRISEIREKIRRRRDESYLAALADWLAAQRVRHQIIAEAAYFRWIDRGQPFGEPWVDWFAAEAETAGDWTQSQSSETFVDQCLRGQLIAEAAYFHWIDRGRPFDEPWVDWTAAEAEHVNGG